MAAFYCLIVNQFLLFFLVVYLPLKQKNIKLNNNENNINSDIEIQKYILDGLYCQIISGKILHQYICRS
jgi:hypothetical protein